MLANLESSTRPLSRLRMQMAVPCCQFLEPCNSATIRHTKTDANKKGAPFRDALFPFFCFSRKVLPKPREIASEHLRKVERQHSIKPLVARDDGFVLRVESDPARHLEDAIRPSHSPSGRHIPIIVDAPDTDERNVRSHLATSTHSSDDPAFRPVDCERPSQAGEAALWSPDHRFRLYVSVVVPVKDAEARTAPAAAGRQDK